MKILEVFENILRKLALLILLSAISFSLYAWYIQESEYEKYVRLINSNPKVYMYKEFEERRDTIKWEQINEDLKKWKKK